MNDEIQAAGRLLTELREAYRNLPQHTQVHVRHLLREKRLFRSQYAESVQIRAGTATHAAKLKRVEFKKG
jgi:hypothetical protein